MRKLNKREAAELAMQWVIEVGDYRKRPYSAEERRLLRRLHKVHVGLEPRRPASLTLKQWQSLPPMGRMHYDMYVRECRIHGITPSLDDFTNGTIPKPVLELIKAAVA